MPIFTDEDSLPATDLTLALDTKDETAAGWWPGCRSKSCGGSWTRCMVGERGYALVLAEDRARRARRSRREAVRRARRMTWRARLPEVAVLKKFADADTFTDIYRTTAGRKSSPQRHGSPI